MRALYYTVITEERDCTLRPLLDWLDYNGYTTVRKLAKADCALSERTAKCSMNVELAVDTMQIGQSPRSYRAHYGGGQFRRLVENAANQRQSE